MHTTSHTKSSSKERPSHDFQSCRRAIMLTVAPRARADTLLRADIPRPYPLRGPRCRRRSKVHLQDLLQLEGPFHSNTRAQGAKGLIRASSRQRSDTEPTAAADRRESQQNATLLHSTNAAARLRSPRFPRPPAHARDRPRGQPSSANPKLDPNRPLDFSTPPRCSGSTCTSGSSD
jgi:hypothetical protein